MVPIVLTAYDENGELAKAQHELDDMKKSFK